MSAPAVLHAAKPRSTAAQAHAGSRVTEVLFLATVLTITWSKLHWAVAGDVALADILTALFLASFAADRLAERDFRLPRTAVVALAFFALFLLVYLAGYYNVDTRQGLEQFGKGMVKFVLHFLFLAAGVAYLLRRSERFYWRTLGVFVAGVTLNALYGIVQLVLARAGLNLDQAVLSPLTGGASAINVYGAVEGTKVYRANALTGDPNHLGIMLLVPLLVLAPLYLRLEPGHRLRLPLAALLGFLLVVELTTLSRSGLLGLAVGVAVLAFPYRGFALSRALLLPLGVVTALIAAVIVRRWEFFERVIRSRVETSGGSSSAHFDVYGFIPDVLSSNPLFGLGLNNFSVYYEFVTGKTNWGPHSFYVALLVESGVVGTALFALFLWWLFARVRVARRLGRALADAGDGRAARLRPLAWGLTAALAGTLAANLFYLTMTFYYFFALSVLAASAPVVFARGSASTPAPPDARRGTGRLPVPR